MKKIFVGMLVMFLGTFGLGKLLVRLGVTTEQKMFLIGAMRTFVDLTNNVTSIITAFAALGSLFLQGSKDI